MLSLEEINAIKNAEKIKMSLMRNIFLLPPILKRSKRFNPLKLIKHELNYQKEKKLKKIIKSSIRQKYIELLYNSNNKICKDISILIGSFII